MSDMDLSNKIVLTPSVLSRMLGTTVTLIESRRNKRTKSRDLYELKVIIISVTPIYASNNFIVEYRSTAKGESFMRSSVILDPDGNSVKNPNDVIKNKYLFVE